MSEYGAEFDLVAQRWKVIESEHDRVHPKRDQCGGVGGCTMMAVAVDLEHKIVDALREWRMWA